MSADGDGNPIFVMSDTYTENVSGTDVTLNRDEVVKPNSNAELTSSLFEFASCGNEGRVCSIQVLKDRSRQHSLGSLVNGTWKRHSNF